MASKNGAAPRQKPPPKRDLSRLTLVFPTATKERMRRLQEKTCSPTLTDTISRAVHWYEWLVEQHEAGRELLVRDGNDHPKILVFTGK